MPTATPAPQGSDVTSGFVVSPSALSVSLKEGDSHSYKIKLASSPAGDVAVAIARRSGDAESILVSPAEMVFNAGNYFIAQQVTISAAEDDMDFADDAATITHTVTAANSAQAGLSIADISVTAADNDDAIVLSTRMLDVPEGGSATYAVKLLSKPSEDVAITLTEAAGEADSDPDLTVTAPAGKTLTFTPANWSAAQPVTVSAANDADKQTGSRRISHAARGGGGGTMTA